MMSDTGAATSGATSGATLRAARQQRGLDVETASRNSALPAAVVQALEACNAASLGADVRLQAQLRVYARSLGVDPEPLLRQVGPRPPGDPDDAVAPMGPPPPSRPPRASGTRSRRAALALVWLGVGAVVGAAVAFVVLSLGGFGAASEPGVRLTSQPAQAEADDGDRAGDRNAGEPAQDAGSPTADADEPTTGDETEETAARVETPDVQAVPGRAPADTTVQLLNGSRDDERLAAAREALEALGYTIVNTEPRATAESWEQTSVYHVAGWEDEAAGLETRDERFVHRGANPGFTADAVLHVVVGEGWPES